MSPLDYLPHFGRGALGPKLQACIQTLEEVALEVFETWFSDLAIWTLPASIQHVTTSAVASSWRGMSRPCAPAASPLGGRGSEQTVDRGRMIGVWPEAAERRKRSSRRGQKSVGLRRGTSR